MAKPGLRGWGCLRSLLGLWGRGSQKSPVRGLTGVQDPAPLSGLGSADGMMPPEMCIRAQLGCSLGISANTKYKQNPANKRLEPGVPPTLGISGQVWKTLKISRSLASRGARLRGRVRARLLRGAQPVACTRSGARSGGMCSAVSQQGPPYLSWSILRVGCSRNERCS